jgi:hypothetical protein
MADLEILKQTVLTGIIQKFIAPPENLGRSLFNVVSHPETVAEWDVIQGNRYRGSPTLPNREGKLVNPLGVGKRSASFIYYREKKAFEPTTLRWLRTPGELARHNAEAAVLREVTDLNYRLERLVESYCWDALKGTITINETDVKATVSMGFDATHTPTAGVLWDDILNADIHGDVKAWKKILVEDSGFAASSVFANSNTMEYVYKNDGLRELWTDKRKDAYFEKGEVSGLLGLNWVTFDGAYVNTSDVTTNYIPDGYIIMIANGGQPFELIEGMSADHDSPDGHTGKFSKSWIETDPSARFVLVEYHFLPIVKYVDQVIYAQVY